MRLHEPWSLPQAVVPSVVLGKVARKLMPLAHKPKEISRGAPRAMVPIVGLEIVACSS